jgi:membrane protein YdbS with pleckstrin-like domain
LVLLIGAIGPAAMTSLVLWGVNPWWLAAALLVYAVTLGVLAWRLEKQHSWSGVALCLAVLLLGAAVVYVTHRRFLR